MTLTGEQFEQLQNALMSAFPKPSDLERMVRFRLNENLQAIAGGGSLSNLTFGLIQWAEAAGRTEELIKGALQEQPRNPELQNFAAELGLDTSSAPAATPRIPSLRKPYIPNGLKPGIVIGILLLASILVLVAIILIPTISRLPVPTPTPMTADELKRAGAYVKIENIDPSPDQAIFTEGEKVAVNLHVSYNLPGPADSPVLRMMYAYKQEPDGKNTIYNPVQTLRATTGKHSEQMQGEIVLPSLSDLGSEPFGIIVTLLVDEQNMKTTVVLDKVNFQLK